MAGMEGIANVASAIIAGASLTGVTIDQISRNIDTGRNVTIQIMNYSKDYTLINPRIYNFSGSCFHAPQPTIAKNTKEVCSFSKIAFSFRGAVGVLMYQILNDGQKCVGELAIMFNVPYDYVKYENYFALGVFDPNTACDDKLFNQMYYGKGSFSRGKGTGSVLVYSGKHALVKGTMSAVGHAIMNVEFYDQKGGA